LSEFQSPSRRIFIGSHSLPPLSGRLIGPSPGRRIEKPLEYRRRPPRRKISPPPEPTYDAYKGLAPPSRRSPPHPRASTRVQCTATSTIRAAANNSYHRPPLPRSPLLKPSPTKVSLGVDSPRPPSSFSPIPGRRRPPGRRQSPEPAGGTPQFLPPLF
jgi:hypothetical protein